MIFLFFVFFIRTRYFLTQLFIFLLMGKAREFCVHSSLKAPVVTHLTSSMNLTYFIPDHFFGFSKQHGKQFIEQCVWLWQVFECADRWPEAGARWFYRFYFYRFYRCVCACVCVFPCPPSSVSVRQKVCAMSTPNAPVRHRLAHHTGLSVHLTHSLSLSSIPAGLLLTVAFRWALIGWELSRKETERENRAISVAITSWKPPVFSEELSSEL